MVLFIWEDTQRLFIFTGNLAHDHLGFLDTLGTYVRTKIIDCELAEPLFGHYIESAYESKEIRHYIDAVKKSGAADFDDLTYLYERMKKKCKD